MDFCYTLAKPINFWSACSKHWMGGPRGGQSINAPSIPAAEEEEKSVFGRNSLLNYPGAAEQTVPLLIRRISTISHFQTTQGEELPLVYHPRSVIRHPGGLLCSPKNIKHRSGFPLTEWASHLFLHLLSLMPLLSTSIIWEWLLIFSVLQSLQMTKIG